MVVFPLNNILKIIHISIYIYFKAAYCTTMKKNIAICTHLLTYA